MTNQERYGERKLIYSIWHRLQGRQLAYIDIDSLEYCQMCKTPLALVELAQDVGQTFKPVTVMTRLAAMANLPAFLVFYTEDSNSEIQSFRVSQVWPQTTNEQIMTPQEYRSFLIGLRKGHSCYQWNEIT